MFFILSSISIFYPELSSASVEVNEIVEELEASDDDIENSDGSTVPVVEGSLVMSWYSSTKE